MQAIDRLSAQPLWRSAPCKRSMCAAPTRSTVRAASLSLARQGKARRVRARLVREVDAEERRLVLGVDRGALGLDTQTHTPTRAPKGAVGTCATARPSATARALSPRQCSAAHVFPTQHHVPHRSQQPCRSYHPRYCTLSSLKTYFFADSVRWLPAKQRAPRGQWVTDESLVVVTGAVIYLLCVELPATAKILDSHAVHCHSGARTLAGSEREEGGKKRGFQGGEGVEKDEGSEGGKKRRRDGEKV
eukprot:1269880-Pleurochrysis_carterae.AAC.2